MKFKLFDVYIRIENELILIGVGLSEAGKPRSPFSSEYVTLSEYENGLKSHIYGKQQIRCADHTIGEYYKEDKVGKPQTITKKWVDELVRLGYNISEIKFNILDA